MMDKKTVLKLLEKMKNRHEEENEKHGGSNVGFFRCGALEATKWAIMLVESIDDCNCGE